MKVFVQAKLVSGADIAGPELTLSSFSKSSKPVGGVTHKSAWDGGVENRAGGSQRLTLWLILLILGKSNFLANQCYSVMVGRLALCIVRMHIGACQPR